MNRFRWLTACAALLSATPVFAQLAVPPDANLFGGDHPAKKPDTGQAPPQEDSARPPVDSVKAAPDYAQVLVFRDNRQLHGKLVEVTANEVIWRRADTSEALHFPRSAVRRIAFVRQRDNQNGFVGVSNEDSADAKSTKPQSATLKLPGGDWLFGEATCPDGETFALRLDKETSVTVHRAQLEWLHFAAKPAPAIGFSGSKLDLEGWTTDTSKMEVAGGTVTIGEGKWIGRGGTLPKRFEVALEVPENGEEGTRLWLQPFGPQVNCYTTGTVELQFGKRQITRQLFLNQFNNQTTQLPKEAREEKGPAKYRVFYDGTTHRVIVQRNGRPVGDWKFESKKEGADNEAQLRDVRITAICFDRQNGGKLQFNRLRVQPWNGVVPTDSDAAESRDELTLGETAPILGKLESLTANELVFSGGTHPKKDLFIRFANAPAALAAPEARVHLGQQGEFSARNLEVHDGHVRCDTAFATALELPAGTVQTISFQDQPFPPAEATDMLVFKNGDELPGHALAAGTNLPTRWKSFSGQELEIQPQRIAGIRFAHGKEARSADAGATLELRDGERLQGNLVALDEKQLRLDHPQLGAFSIDRTRLWHLFPNPAVAVAEGGRDPNSWIRSAAPEEQPTSHQPDEIEDSWIHLDGTYILRDGNSVSNNSDDWRGLQREIPANLDRFEVRVEETSATDNPANLFLRLTNQKSNLTWQATVSYSDLQLVVYGGENRRPNWRDIPLQDKLADLRAPRSIRIFADTKTGTCDLFINGSLIAHLGQDPGERLKPGGYVMHFQPYPMNAGLCVLSNLWIGPWLGDLPRADKTAEATTALSNGDAAPGTPKTLHEGKLAMDGDLGAFEVPLAKVQEVDFGGVMLPEQAAGRLRLADGTVVNLTEFHWDSHELTAQSATLGKLRLPASSVAELIYDPPPAHAPKNPESKRVAQKDPPDQNAIPAARP